LKFAAGAVTEIVKLIKPLDDGQAASPDGRTLVYSQIDHVGLDLMLVENFR
jgi:hypothetical protein